MISFLTMAVHAIAGLLISVLKAFFSMLSWFISSFFKALKIFFCVLPVTATVFALLFCINIFLLIGGGTGVLSLGIGGRFPDKAPAFDMPGSDFIPNEDIRNEADRMLTRNDAVVSEMFSSLKDWWLSSVYIYHGSIAYIFLLIFTVVMFVPVIAVLLSLSVFMSFGSLIFYAVIADIVLYLFKAVLGKNFISQAQGRYFRLFPAAGKKHYEKNYEKWLRRHNGEFEEDNRNYRKNRHDDFYGDDEYEDDEYTEDESYEYEDEEEDYYEKGYYEKFEYDYFNEKNMNDSDFYEDYEDDDIEDSFYEDDYAFTSGSLDFFAGCNSRESVDRKYKSLVKLYHPDNMDGDTAALQEINAQYAKAKKKF